MVFVTTPYRRVKVARQTDAVLEFVRGAGDGDTLFRDWLRVQRGRLGLSQARAADLIGRSGSWWSNFERGRFELGPELLETIREGLGISFAPFLTEVDVPIPPEDDGTVLAGLPIEPALRDQLVASATLIRATVGLAAPQVGLDAQRLRDSARTEAELFVADSLEYLIAPALGRLDELAAEMASAVDRATVLCAGRLLNENRSLVPKATDFAGPFLSNVSANAVANVIVRAGELFALS